jgi:hypothetical protein
MLRVLDCALLKSASLGINISMAEEVTIGQNTCGKGASYISLVESPPTLPLMHLELLPLLLTKKT